MVKVLASLVVQSVSYAISIAADLIKSVHAMRFETYSLLVQYQPHGLLVISGRNRLLAARSRRENIPSVSLKVTGFWLRSRPSLRSLISRDKQSFIDPSIDPLIEIAFH
jgi:hypothetical protein